MCLFSVDKAGLFVIFILFSTLALKVGAQPAIDNNISSRQELVRQFYNIGGKSFGIRNNHVDPELYQFFRQTLDSCQYDGLDKNDYRYRELFPVFSIDSVSAEWQYMYTDAVTAYCKDIYQGYGITGEVSYNGILNVKADSLLYRLSLVQSKHDFEVLLNRLQPSMDGFQLLKNELKKEIQAGNYRRVSQLKKTLNNFRWISHFKFQKCIVVNIPSATLNYYSNGSLVLDMRIVVGKPSTKTPRFTAYCNEVILYPYWHVPRSIAVNELLPIIKKRPSVINAMNLQVLNAKGNVVSASAINWSRYNKYNFPYQLRQSTGCDNALGVIKFNLTSPFSVYLHDTNFKGAFTSQNRYLSHGCIRIEKPVELANYLLPQIVDSSFLRACVRGQKPVVYALGNPVPVFVLYQTAWPDLSGSIVYHKDIYHLQN